MNPRTDAAPHDTQFSSSDICMTTRYGDVDRTSVIAWDRSSALRQSETVVHGVVDKPVENVGGHDRTDGLGLGLFVAMKT